MSTVLAPPELSITTVRTLAMDAVQKANSGHPGAPMGLAAVGWSLFTGPLRHAPTDPDWPNRDRFVLSNGHASMLLYALLHLTGYDLPLSEIERFRQLGTADARATRSAATRPASRSPPAPWARASPTPWASRSPSGCWPPATTGRDTR